LEEQVAQVAVVLETKMAAQHQMVDQETLQ
jgi:hypothetical protein